MHEAVYLLKNTKTSYNLHSHGVVSREFGNGSIETNFLLIYGGVEEWNSLARLVTKSGAIGSIHAISVSSLKFVAVSPPHDEVTVISITSGITTAESETVEILDVLSLKEKLEENGKDSNGVGLGANSSIVVTNCGVSNMAVVVGSVKILTIPARREIHLGPQGATVTSGESRVLTIWSIKAHNRNGLLCKVVVVLSTSSGITSNHSETIGES